VKLVRLYRQYVPHVRVFLMYGLSEAFRSTYLPPEEVDRHPDSIGKAIPETEIFLVGPDNRLCNPGTLGELVHSGPTVALGYWNNPVATARVFRTDPRDPRSRRAVVYSGDLASVDDDGLLHFRGRRDQLIKSYGYRVSPDEVEQLIYESHAVAEVIVHGRPDDVAGTAIVAHVVPVDPRRFEASALLEFCRTQMPAYMVPAAIEVHESLPRNATGKLDRRAFSR